MKSIALCALLTPVIAGGGLALWPQPPSSALPSPSMKQAAVVALAVAAANNPSAHLAADTNQSGGIDLHSAVQKGVLTGEFRGNGREQMRAILTNKTKAPVVVRVPAGQMFEAGRNVVIVVRAGEVEL